MTSLAETRLSVLDLSPVAAAGTAADALRETVELARHAESLGYHRYWLAEHHNMPGIASSATPVLIGAVAAATERIRVGSGGVMLPNHAPLIVAEQFGTLTALYPDRIDLGLGRAPGSDQRTALAVRGSARALAADDFPQQLTELLAYFEPDPQRAVNAITAEGNRPPVWLLGSSGFSAQMGGMLGLPFAFAHHFSAQNTLPAIELYRRHFRPSATLAEPHLMLGASVVCAETDERAEWLAKPSALAFLSLRRGRPVPLPSPEDAAAYDLDELEQAFVDDRRSSEIVGSPETVRKGLESLVDETGADEVMVTTMVPKADERRRSYELVAELTR